MKPLVAIVGRANVGKSRLFNRLVGENRALVHDLPGITRDRHYAAADWSGKSFIVIDTGGIDLAPEADLEKKVSAQSLAAIAEADVIVLVFDGQHDPTAHDHELVQRLRPIERPLIFAINKIDEELHEGLAAAYHRLGVGPLIPTSAEHGRGIDDLLDAIIRHFPEEPPLAEDSAATRIAVIGRPNVGKSTLVNRLCGAERVVVHDLPGTTRDAIDIEMKRGEDEYIFVDTAGVSKHYRVDSPLEKVTALRSLRAVERAHIVLLVVDASEGLTKQDLSLAGFAVEQGKGVIMLFNKWDLTEVPWDDFREDSEARLGELADVTMLPISAKTGLGCHKILDGAKGLQQQLRAELKTSELNALLEQALAEHHLPTYKGKQVRIFYGTQTGSHPPTVTLFSNVPKAVPYAYRRYLMRRLKERFGLTGVPIKIILRHRT